MPEDLPPGLEALRERIDEVDRRLVELFGERARLAQQVGEVKRAAGEADQCYRPGREAEVLRRARDRNSGPLDDATAARLVREVMSACLALEQQLEVAFLGPEGTFTHLAMRRHFGGAVSGLAVPSVEEVFRTVTTGRADYGVVPVENSVEGAVNVTLDAFTDHPVRVCGEVMLRVRHNLLGRSGTAGAKRVSAHPQALAQCRGWLDRNLPGLERVPVTSNAEAARQAAADEELLAVASREAAEHYDLSVLEADIEDDPNNTTRFLVIGAHDAEPSSDDKTSLLLYTSNQPGSLYRALAVFAEHGVNLTRIESRPARRSADWEYVFFIDVLGHASRTPVASALRELEAHADEVRVLGAYPRAVPL